MSQEEIFVVGYPKSGNTWLSRLLGDLLDSPVQARAPKHAIGDEGFDRKGKYVIRQEHIDHKTYKGEKPIILITRDPRDVAVSAWKYWGRPSLIDTLHCMGKGTWPITHGGGWSSFYQFWLDNRSYNILVRYESLVYNTENMLLHACRGIDLNDIQLNSRMKEVVKRQSFEARKKIAKEHGDTMPYGKSVQNGLLRRGVVGDWKNFFDDKCNNLAIKYFGNVAKTLGYDLNGETN